MDDLEPRVDWLWPCGAMDGIDYGMNLDDCLVFQIIFNILPLFKSFDVHNNEVLIVFVFEALWNLKQRLWMSLFSKDIVPYVAYSRLKDTVNSKRLGGLQIT